MTGQSIKSLLASLPIDLRPYEDLYSHFHSHPELSLQESETASTIASHLRSLNAGYTIHTSIGGHGVAGVLDNGAGKIVLLRADMDALPVGEKTGLDYASKVTMKDNDDLLKPVMHACGHDFHITSLLGAAERLANLKDKWSGTLIVLFQPNEERGAGASAMVEDGLYNKIPVPDVCLGGHVMAMKAGHVGSRIGTVMSESDRFKVTLFGRGGHGSMPHRTVDPVVMAAHVVLRLQNIVSREVDANEFAVVTVGKLHAGHTENIIADEAEIRVDVRTQKPKVRDQVLAAVHRIVKGECEASGATKEPLIEISSKFPMTVNDESVAKTIEHAFSEYFGPKFDPNIPCSNASEDFSVLGTSQGRPCCFWFYGGVDEKTWDEKEKAGRIVEDIP
ncbi:MAG: hypothetical protein Q9190_007617, partial [Brigantiaea leucoxantha]